MENSRLNIIKEKGVATLEFYHPSSNSIPSELLNRMVTTFNELSLDTNVKVVIIKSSGDGAFCAGASFDELLKIDNAIDGIAFFSAFGKLVNAMRKCMKPIIGRIHGKSVGGGVGIIAACDYVLASEAASIKLSEISIGIGPFVVEPAITRKIGVAAFCELAYNPTFWQSAFWAKEKGLFSRVFESRVELDNEVTLLANQLASYSELAVQNLKAISWNGTDNWEELMHERAKICGNLVLSETTKKALLKFKEKH